MTKLCCTLCIIVHAVASLGFFLSFTCTCLEHYNALVTVNLEPRRVYLLCLLLLLLYNFDQFSFVSVSGFNGLHLEHSAWD